MIIKANLDKEKTLINKFKELLNRSSCPKNTSRYNKKRKYNKTKNPQKNNEDYDVQTQIAMLLKAHNFISQGRNNTTLEFKDEKKIIRLDFDGIVHYNPSKHDSVYIYKKNYAQYLNKYGGGVIKRHKFNDYDLNQSSIWQFMSNFSNLKQLRPLIINTLIKYGIPPYNVKKLCLNDFLDIFQEKNKAVKEENKDLPVKEYLFEDKKRRNLRIFAYAYGKEYAQIMKFMGNSTEEIEKNINLMKRGVSPKGWDMHHKINVSRFYEASSPDMVNDISNMMIIPNFPHHRLFHTKNDYKIQDDVIFFGGFDPYLQIIRDPEKEALAIKIIEQKNIESANTRSLAKMQKESKRTQYNKNPKKKVRYRNDANKSKRR